MIDRQKWLLAALSELFRMQRENCAVQGDEIALAIELSELENRFEKTIDRLALRSVESNSFSPQDK